MSCHPACCASSRTSSVTGAESMSASRAYPARSKRWRGKIKGCERLMTVPALGRSSRARGGRDRHWRYVLERPRLRRVAWAGTETNLHRRPNNSRQHIKTRQSLICVLDLGENGTTAGIELVSCRELLATSKMLLEGAGSKSKATGCRIKRAERRR